MFKITESIAPSSAYEMVQWKIGRHACSTDTEKEEYHTYLLNSQTKQFRDRLPLSDVLQALKNRLATRSSLTQH